LRIALAINYNKLWKLLIDRGINKTQLSQKSGVSSSAIAKLGKNEQISMDSMLKICKTLNCHVGDIIDYDPSKDVAEGEGEEAEQDAGR
jgi:DNA (cytosine-5)-methyltransferase 1